MSYTWLPLNAPTAKFPGPNPSIDKPRNCSAGAYFFARKGVAMPMHGNAEAV